MVIPDTNDESLAIKIATILGLDPYKVLRFSIEFEPKDLVIANVVVVVDNSEGKEIVELLKQYRLEEINAAKTVG